jgi:hypothetical protein
MSTAPALEAELSDLRRSYADLAYKFGYLCGVVAVEPDLPLAEFQAQVRQKLPLFPPRLVPLGELRFGLTTTSEHRMPTVSLSP